VLLLFVSALVATILVGREQGFEDRTEIAATLGFALLVALAVYVTLDLNQPTRGLVTVSQAPIERVLLTMNPSPARNNCAPQKFRVAQAASFRDCWRYGRRPTKQRSDTLDAG
jgi:hypothetical protein